MDIELAKKLKEAGFPFKERYLESHNGESSELQWDNADWEYPTLSELIEACGKRFKFLERIQMVDDTDDGIEIWFRCNDNTMTDSHFPEEAVATLWLVLNKK